MRNGGEEKEVGKREGREWGRGERGGGGGRHRQKDRERETESERQADKKINRDRLTDRRAGR